MFTINLAALKEPRGFIRVLQLVIATLSFSLLCSYTGSTSVQVFCGAQQKTLTINVTYPFQESWTQFTPPEECKKKTEIKFPTVPCDLKSKAQFFVFMGVLSLLVCVVSLPIYVLKADLYGEKSWIPLVDCGTTVCMTFLWLCAFWAWFTALADLANYTSFENLTSILPACEGENTCRSGQLLSLTKLKMALAAGFLDFILWLGGSWFLYKETSFHDPGNKSMSPSQATQTMVTDSANY